MKTVEVADFKIYSTNETEQHRADSFWEKEPETIEWIKSFKNGEVVFDIGANIGIYSLYMASLCHGSRIHAFEPHIINNNQLRLNIELNGFKNIESHLCIVGKENGRTRFYMQSDVAGSSGSQLGSPVDEHGQEFVPSCNMDMEQFTVDELATMYDKPHHIKIDVDGHELDIMKGMDETIQDKTLKSILIECNKNCINISQLTQKLEWHGFTLDNDFNRMENHSRVRRGGNPENLIFVRKG